MRPALTLRTPRRRSITRKQHRVQTCELAVLDNLSQALKTLPPAPRVRRSPAAGLEPRLEPLLYELDLGRALEFIELDAHEALRVRLECLPRQS